MTPLSTFCDVSKSIRQRCDILLGRPVLRQNTQLFSLFGRRAFELLRLCCVQPLKIVFHVVTYCSLTATDRTTLQTFNRDEKHPECLTMLYFWPPTKRRGIILVVSVCLYVCQTIIYESLNIRSSYLHMRHISMEYGSCSYIKVVGSRSRSHEPKRLKSPIPTM